MQQRQVLHLTHRPVINVQTDLDNKIPFEPSKVNTYLGFIPFFVKPFDMMIKRLGYLLDKLGIGTEIVEELRALRTAAVSPLDTEVPNEGKICTKWSIRQNVDIETIINTINN